MLAEPNLCAVSLTLGVVCKHCDTTIPVNGFMEVAKCNVCRKETELSGKLRWEEILNYQNPNVDIFYFTKRQRPLHEESGAWQPVKLRTCRRWPVCFHCSHQYNMEDMENAIRNNQTLVCPECKESVQLKNVPEYIQKVFPSTLYAIDRIAENKVGDESKFKKSNPVSIACMSCGGTLSVDGDKRLVPCKFCGSSNYLPDDLWFALYPPQEMVEWFILFDLDKVSDEY